MRTVHRCQECGGTSPRWLGRCPACGAWGAIVQDPVGPGGVPTAGTAPVAIAHAGADGSEPAPTAVGELDRVVAGGLLPGSVTLIGGEPGIGKSTLVLQALAGLAARGSRCLLVSAEESPSQVAMRAARIGAAHRNLFVVAEASLTAVAAHVEEFEPHVLALDSIQTVHDPEVAAGPGSVAQVRACAHRLVQLAKRRCMATLLVGHVTKDGALAGPRVLEHLVDTVVSFEGDRDHGLRLLRVLKHRFGSTQELGVMEMTGAGLVDVPDPSSLLLADRPAGVPGSIVAAMLDGRRPLVVEVQALVVETQAGRFPRRSTQGVDAGRLAMLAAIVERHTEVSLRAMDVYVSLAGGVRAADPGTDLAVALALVGAARNRAVPGDAVAIGELGLGGEVRQARQAERRLSEAARLGFATAVAPMRTPEVAGIRLVRVATLAEAGVVTGLS